MADKYFAGYTANTNPPNPTDSIGAMSALSQRQLHKVLIDEAGGSAVEGVSVIIGSGTGLTDNSGTFEYSLPKALNGTYNITATKLGYQKGTKSIEVTGYVEKMLSIEGTHTLYAPKSGYLTAARDINIQTLFSEFKANDINIIPDVLMTGETAVIKSNITNTGTKKDTLPVVLMVNNTEVDSKMITLAPAETKEVDFMYNSTLHAGNFTVDILGQMELLRIEQKKTTPAYEAVSTIWILLLLTLILRKRKS